MMRDFDKEERRTWKEKNFEAHVSEQRPKQSVASVRHATVMIGAIPALVRGTTASAPAQTKLAGCVRSRDQNILKGMRTAEFPNMAKCEPLRDKEPKRKTRDEGAPNSVPLCFRRAHRRLRNPDAACGQRERWRLP